MFRRCASGRGRVQPPALNQLVYRVDAERALHPTHDRVRARTLHDALSLCFRGAQTPRLQHYEQHVGLAPRAWLREGLRACLRWLHSCKTSGNSYSYVCSMRCWESSNGLPSGVFEFKHPSSRLKPLRILDAPAATPALRGCGLQRRALANTRQAPSDLGRVSGALPAARSAGAGANCRRAAARTRVRSAAQLLPKCCLTAASLRPTDAP
jgi:hypothetical protein